MANPIGISGDGPHRLEIYPEGLDLTPTAVTVLRGYRMLNAGWYRGDPAIVDDATRTSEGASAGATWLFPVQTSGGVNAGETIVLPAAEANALITAERAVAL